jgi:hypothetical protein
LITFLACNRKRNERFFLSGIALVNLIEASSKQVAKAIVNSGRNPRRNKHSAAFEAVKLEAEELRKTLLLVRVVSSVVTFAVERSRADAYVVEAFVVHVLTSHLLTRFKYLYSLYSRQAYTGDRLGHTLDWALSSVGDDVTSYTCKLTEMERRLFSRGAKAISNLTRWRLHGNKRCVVRKIAPFTKEEREMMDEDRENKRQRTSK